MYSKPEQYRFVGRDEADTVIGERVIVRVELPAPAVGSFGNISLLSFTEHVRRCFAELLKKHGSDCEGFELTYRDGVYGVIFTRPMDVVEQTQINAYRLRQAQGETQQDLSDDDRIARHRPPLPDNRLPDPSVPALGDAVVAPVL